MLTHLERINAFTAPRNCALVSAKMDPHVSPIRLARPARRRVSQGGGLPEFTTSFQFVGSDDAREASSQKRSHVMREYRRRERWERELGQGQKKERKKQREATGENNPPRKAVEQAGRKRTVAAMKSQFRYRAIHPATLLERRKLHLELPRQPRWLVFQMQIAHTNQESASWRVKRSCRSAVHRCRLSPLMGRS
jgi:hypothetical protein